MASSAAGPSQHAYRASSPQTENVLILGLRRSGKSSIINVVYKSLSPDDSLFLESTLKCQYFDVNTFQKVRIWDGTGGDLEASSLATSQQHQNLSKDRLKQTSIDNDPRGKLAWGSSGQLYWTECAALVFVIDSQDDLYDAIDRLNEVILDAYASNPLIAFHVFVHKVDGHSTDYRYDTLQSIQSRVADNLADASPSFIFEPTAQAILSEAFENQQAGSDDEDDTNFETERSAANGKWGASVSSLTVGPGVPSGVGPDLEHDVRLSFHTTSIYNPSVFVAFSRVQMGLMNMEVAKTLETLCNGLCSSCQFEKVYLFDVPTRTFIATDTSPYDESNFEAMSEYLNFLVNFSGLYRNLGDSSNDRSVRYSTSSARLSSDTTLAFHQVNSHLALAYIVRSDIHSENTGMIDFNITIARRAVAEVYDTCTSS